MRIKEILTENSDELLGHVNDLVIKSKSVGINRITTDKLVKALNMIGYSIDKAGLISALKDNPMIQNAADDFVELKSDEVSDIDPEQNKERVSDIASKTAMRNIK